MRMPRKTAARRLELDTKWYSNLHNYYALQGGIEIPSGADLKSDAYRKPGNYYCPTNDIAATLINSPVSNAFILKVEKATGDSYPKQIFKEYNTGKIISRVYSLSQGIWFDEISYVTNSEINDTVIKDLASKIDSNFVSSDYSPSFFVSRTANTIMVSIFAGVRNLTGRDTIMPAGSIPADFVPPWSINLAIQGRNAPTWATASYYPCVLNIREDGSVDLITGTNKSNIVFIAGDMMYPNK